MRIANAKQEPKIFYGLHFAEGVAEYKDGETSEAYRILISEKAIKNMDPSFQGKPVYVDHVDSVDLDKIHEADGYVVDSFYNKSDGKHWAKFIVVSDKAHEAIRAGWKLSNAYIPEHFAGGGLWHGVEYLKEVTGGRYEHLAIVPNPRYSESTILTPEQFKSYNEGKELELKKLANSKDPINKGAHLMKFNFFKKDKVENTADLENLSVTLPKSGKEFTLTTLINEMDKIVNMQGYASGDHMVKLNDDEEVSVNDLVEKYSQMCLAKKNEEDEALKKKENEAKDLDKKENEEDPEKKENDEEYKKENEEEEKKENEEAEKAVEAKKNALKHFESLKNAPFKFDNENKTVELSMDRTARGHSRYGSGK